LNGRRPLSTLPEHLQPSANADHQIDRTPAEAASKVRRCTQPGSHAYEPTTTSWQNYLKDVEDYGGEDAVKKLIATYAAAVFRHDWYKKATLESLQ
jgi:hypothetical protein